MYVTIDKVLKNKSKTIYWLSKQIGCDYYSLQKLVNNKTTSISFSLMQDICKALNCTANDIFQIE